MPTIDELLQRVRDRPSDDEARLILADALLESNDPMGAFITLQFKFAEGRRERGELQLAADLLIQNLRRWLGPLASCVRRRSSRFDKGFLSHATLAFGPLPPERLAEIHASPVWGTVTSVHLESQEEHGLRACLTAPALKHLTALECRQPVLEVLASWPLPFRLKRLAVAVGVDDPLTFARSEAWEALEVLRVDSHRASNAVPDLARFAKACGARRLEAALGGFTDDDWVADLCRWKPDWPNEIRVELSANRGAVELTADTFELQAHASDLNHITAHLVALEALIHPRAHARLRKPGGEVFFEGSGRALTQALPDLARDL